jgi:hypothetical protein
LASTRIGSESLPTADHKHILIDGKWVDPDVTSTNTVVDPAEIHMGSVGDADWVVRSKPHEHEGGGGADS